MNDETSNAAQECVSWHHELLRQRRLLEDRMLCVKSAENGLAEAEAKWKRLRDLDEARAKGAP